MGSLNPGATYIYERVAGTIFAREFGSTERKVVGYDTNLGVAGGDRLYGSEMNEVLRMCETDPAMRELLDQLLVMYNLKKTHE